MKTSRRLIGSSDRPIPKSQRATLTKEDVDLVARLLLVEKVTIEECAERVADRGITLRDVTSLRSARSCQALWIDAIARLGRRGLIS